MLWGVGLQFTFAVLILKTTPGRAVFNLGGAAIRQLVGFATEGTKFVFGPLADADAMSGSFGPENGLVLAILIAFIALVALVNFILVWPQTHLGVATPITLQTLLGWINAPFAWLMGVPAQDVTVVGGVLGERIVLSEFIGYLSLNSLTVDERSYTIATYALCGFANVASVAIQVGGIGSLAPVRRSDMAQLGVKAMIGGLLATYLTACIAGILL